MIIRWLAIVSIVVWVAVQQGLPPTLFYVMLCVAGLLLQGLSVAHLLKSLKLLLWLFLPTMLFHGLFTPGTMVQHPFYIPLSKEGLAQGLLICMHIALVFFAAMFVFRVFSKTQWLSMLETLPFARKLKPYLLLLLAIQQHIPDTLHKKRAVWEEQQQRWSALPHILMQAIEDVVLTAKVEAQSLWQHWDIRIARAGHTNISLFAARDILYLVLMVMGWGLFWLM